jgi:hypothetical protein
MRQSHQDGAGATARVDEKVGVVNEVLSDSRELRGSAAARTRTEWIEVPVPALVSEAMFALAQEQLEKNKNHSPRRTIEPTLLQGILVCEQCGYSHTAHRRARRSTNCITIAASGRMEELRRWKASWILISTANRARLAPLGLDSVDRGKGAQPPPPCAGPPSPAAEKLIESPVPFLPTEQL